MGVQIKKYSDAGEGENNGSLGVLKSKIMDTLFLSAYLGCTDVIARALSLSLSLSLPTLRVVKQCRS
jgi:hypothetical protein